MSDMIFPSHIQIEPINGACTSRCIMCTFESWTRKPNRMTHEQFKLLLDKLAPHKDRFKMMTLHGAGEPLLDKDLPDKVALAKEMGFHGVGLASNCTELDETTARRLIEAGLDTIICSIDGIDAQTHQAIRRGTDFAVICQNVRRYIRLRDQLDAPVRVVVRFIRQELNKGQWPQVQATWQRELDFDKGDDVLVFDVHNWGDTLDEYDPKDPNRGVRFEPVTCEDLYQRLIIASNGEVLLCAADDDGFIPIGNAFQQDPIDIYNGPVFTRHRQLMAEGNIHQLKHCRNCTMPRSRSMKRSTQDDLAASETS